MLKKVLRIRGVLSVSKKIPCNFHAKTSGNHISSESMSQAVWRTQAGVRTIAKCGSL